MLASLWRRWRRATLLAAADRYSRQNGIDPRLTRALVYWETRSNPGYPVATRERDGTIVYGNMQIKPATAAQMGWAGENARALMGPLGVYYGVRYMAWQRDRYGGDVRKMLSAYNAGTATPANAAYVDGVLRSIGEL